MTTAETRKDPRAIIDSDVNNKNAVQTDQRSVGRHGHKQGGGTVDTLNYMTGDIPYAELQNIPGVSTMALYAKLNADNMSIFRRVGGTSSLPQGGKVIAYWNIGLLLKFVSDSGTIVSSRVSCLPKARQKQVESAVKIARFLALLPFTEH